MPGLPGRRTAAHIGSFFNPGLPEDKENLVIPQLEVDPRTGTVYALLTGDALISRWRPIPEFTGSMRARVRGNFFAEK